MPNLRLIHLTLVGSSVAPASIEFGPRLTVVHGPSDTGKSFVVDAIDFMLGGKGLKEIPERQGYQRVLLGLELHGDTRITLSRAVTGGHFGLYYSDIREHTSDQPDETLAGKHDADDPENLSHFLLEVIGLTNRWIRKNAQGVTVSLSFRNVAHLCVVDETQMQAKVPPPFTGNPVTHTAELSTFRLLLEAEDDSYLPPVVDPKVAKAMRGARLELVEQIKERFRGDTSSEVDPAQLTAQLDRLETALAEVSVSMEDLRLRRDALTQQLASVQQDVAASRSRIGDLTALTGRFALLQTQYQSDLARLDLLAEAGNLLGFFSPGVCPFCGAEPEAQHLNVECETDTTHFAESVEAERLKTAALSEDLAATLSDLSAEIHAEDQNLAALQSEVLGLQGELTSIERTLTPQAANLDELLVARSAAERSLHLLDQMKVLESLQLELSAAVPAKVKVEAKQLDLSVLDAFSAEMSKCLKAWNVAEAETVRFDRLEEDLIAGGQLRKGHGKGVRAILHAAFTVGLAQYCTDRALPHPGFVLLDSPLVTYRPPDLDEEGQDLAQATVAQGFYQDVQERIGCQVIVMENVSPPDLLGPETVSVGFTKAPGQGRYGFFPV